MGRMILAKDRFDRMPRHLRHFPECKYGVPTGVRTSAAPTGSCLRLGLWAEHLGTFRPEFLEPHSEQCMRLVRQMALDNWRAYTSPQPQKLPHGHLCRYPYDVDRDGNHVWSFFFAGRQEVRQ